MMKKYENAIKELRSMILVGGTLCEADEILQVFEELLENYKDCRNELCVKCGEYIKEYKGGCLGCKYYIDYLNNKKVGKK